MKKINGGVVEKTGIFHKNLDFNQLHIQVNYGISLILSNFKHVYNLFLPS